MHSEKSPLAGQTLRIKSGLFKDNEYWVEDWWDHLTGGSWAWARGNPSCLDYAVRGVIDNLPNDDEVLYGKIGILGKLVHISELDIDGK